jgi:hypothetical protein
MHHGTPYAILRVTPLRSWSAVSAMTRHGRRQGSDMAHVDRSRSPLNRHGSEWHDQPADLRACMEAVTTYHGAVRRKGSPLGSHLLLTASPEYFRPENPTAMGTWDQARLDAWLKANVEWVRCRWPGQVASWRLDLDEATPHCDFFLVPIHHWRTRGGKTVTQVSHRHAFGASRRSFAALQDDYAKAMEPLGLKRGRPRAVTGAVHVHPAELRRRMAVDAARQRGLTIGLGAILRRDIRQLGKTPDGAPTATFSAVVPFGQRNRLLDICRPSWPALMRFERELGFQARRLASQVIDELTSTAQSDREEASRTLNEARDIWELISEKDRSLRGRAWEDLVLDLIR